MILYATPLTAPAWVYVLALLFFAALIACFIGGLMGGDEE